MIQSVMKLIVPRLSGTSLKKKRQADGTYALARNEYYEAGDSVPANENTPYVFPMPAIDGYAGSYVSVVDGGTNANGDFEGVLVSSKVNINGFSWKGLDAETGRKLIQTFTNPANFTFFAKYYDLIRGTEVIRQFYRGDIEYAAHNIVEENGMPEVDFWANISLPVKEV